MAIDQQGTHYDVLDITPDASAQEVREAYFRAKSAYNKDSVALYTLIDPEERETMLRRIEEAYHVLANDARRKEYDRCHGLLAADLTVETETLSGPLDPMLLAERGALSPPPRENIISIDRVPPMESRTNDDILVPPNTDFSPGGGATLPPARMRQPEPATRSTAPKPVPTMDPQSAQELAEEIAREVEWRGGMIRRIRESYKISLEEMAGVTRISKTYLNAIEEENFAKLPAAVYLRGFIVQVAKLLKLPHEKVAPAYLARYYQARVDQTT